MKDENIKTGKAMLEAEAKRKGYNLNDLLTESSFNKLSNKLVFSSVNEMMASVYFRLFISVYPCVYRGKRKPHR